MYDTSTLYTDLATIDFTAPSISYQRAFPKISNMQTAVFSSPTVYYWGLHDTKFNKYQSTSY